jgi:hypothetical protein
MSESTKGRLFMTLKKLAAVLLSAMLIVALSGCGDTWQGVKKDTGDNLEATGKAVEKAGEKVKE